MRLSVALALRAAVFQAVMMLQFMSIDQAVFGQTLQRWCEVGADVDEDARDGCVDGHAKGES